VVGHHQRSARRGDVLHVSHLGAIPPLDDRSEGLGDLFGEGRIPFGGLVIVGRLGPGALHDSPLSCSWHLLLIAAVAPVLNLRIF
jgi:hypothetical protein